MVSSLLSVLTLVVVGLGAEARLEAVLTAQARLRAATTADELVDEYMREGQAGLKDSIAPRLHEGEHRMRYALINHEGRLILGDDALCGTLVDCLDLKSRPTGQDLSSLVVQRELEADGLALYVIDDVPYIRDVRSILQQAFWYAVAATVLTGGGIGYFLSRHILRQLGSMTLTAEAIISGDLSRRIAATGTTDEFDGLRRTLNRMLDRITDLLRNVQQVSTDIAHDLRTPLSRLRHRLERAQTTAQGGHRPEVIDAAIGELDVVLETFSALLRIAQIESGNRRSEFRRQDLSRILDDVAETYQTVAEENGRQMTASIAPGLTVVGDRELLTQLLCNLVENALTHTPDGTRVNFHASAGEETTRIIVADNGPGIDEGDLPFVFRRFYRGERSRSSPGTGLGLSVVTAIVELHGGVIELENNCPGLTAAVTLPREAE
jgi:signal transduction histidine kinase